MSRSNCEEVIGLLWFLLAAVAKPYIPTWLMAICLVFGALSMLASIAFAIAGFVAKQSADERKEGHEDQ